MPQVQSAVEQKLKEAEEADPGYITILGKSIHRSNPILSYIVLALVITVCSSIAVVIPKILYAG
jgi:hypothetical protein